MLSFSFFLLLCGVLSWRVGGADNITAMYQSLVFGVLISLFAFWKPEQPFLRYCIFILTAYATLFMFWHTILFGLILKQFIGNSAFIITLLATGLGAISAISFLADLQAKLANSLQEKTSLVRKNSKTKSTQISMIRYLIAIIIFVVCALIIMILVIMMFLAGTGPDILYDLGAMAFFLFLVGVVSYTAYKLIRLVLRYDK